MAAIAAAIGVCRTYCWCPRRTDRQPVLLVLPVVAVVPTAADVVVVAVAAAGGAVAVVAAEEVVAGDVSALVAEEAQCCYGSSLDHQLTPNSALHYSRIELILFYMRGI
jgi:hypothetical protein